MLIRWIVGLVGGERRGEGWGNDVSKMGFDCICVVCVCM